MDMCGSLMRQLQASFQQQQKKNTLCTNSSLFIPFICILRQTAYTPPFGSPIYFIIVLMHEFGRIQAYYYPERERHSQRFQTYTYNIGN